MSNLHLVLLRGEMVDEDPVDGHRVAQDSLATGVAGVTEEGESREERIDVWEREVEMRILSRDERTLTGVATHGAEREWMMGERVNLWEMQILSEDERGRKSMNN